MGDSAPKVLFWWQAPSRVCDKAPYVAPHVAGALLLGYLNLEEEHGGPQIN